MDTNTITAKDEIGAETGREPIPHAMRGPGRSEEPSGPAHVLILAGGDGLRSRAVTRALAGDERPKQFCALVSNEPLLVEAQHRASMIVPPSRTILVLTRPHEPYYRDLVDGIPPGQLVVQPQNRGTAPAVLYGLLRVAARAPNAPVAILPSDHWVSDDAVFMAHAAAAIGIVRAHPGAVVLLGIAPTRAEREYGWIEPAEPVADVWSDLHGVRRFVEKPDADLARRLEASGRSLWNTSVVIGRVEALLFLFALARPELVDAFLGIWPALGSRSEAQAVERLYANLPAGDFSKDILAGRPESLTVLAVSGVAWEDVGHPARILAARRHVSQSRERARQAPAAGFRSRTA
jgi:mannose-1-phosphate guanylyltransferase